ncbi:MAG: AI-2E family transporter, partial [Duncaniella sp.]|nr:AI-2E family transporter [Duncaniella sp.]
MSTSRPITFDRVMRFLFAALVIAGIIWLVDILRNVLLPFFLACLISYILQPIVEFCMTRLHIRWRIVAIFVTLITVGGVIFGLAYLFVPSIVKEIHHMGTLINDYATRGDPSPLLPKNIHDYLVG